MPPQRQPFLVPLGGGHTIPAGVPCPRGPGGRSFSAQRYRSAGTWGGELLAARGNRISEVRKFISLWQAI